jgi:hypothetical protein
MLKFIVTSLGSVSTLATFGFAGTAAMNSSQGQVLLGVLSLLVALFALFQWLWSLRVAPPAQEPKSTQSIQPSHATGEIPCKTAR